MRVRYTPPAFEDREKIFDFLAARSPQAAQDVVGLIKLRINQLGNDFETYKGQKTSRAGLYSFWVAPYPYRVFYRVIDDEVVIVHIRHTSMRRWKPNF